MAWYRLSGVVYTLWLAGIAPLLPRDEREGGRENLGGVMRLTSLVFQMNILGSLQTYPIANEHEQCMSPTSPSLSHTPAAPTSHFASPSLTFCTMMQQGRLNNLLKHSSNQCVRRVKSPTLVSSMEPPASPKSQK